MIQFTGDITDTLNVVTIVSAITTGLMFGYFAFVPLIRRITPPDPPDRPVLPFWAVVAIVVIVFGSTLTVFYAEQLVTETIATGTLRLAAVGRFLTSMVFLTAFGIGVAWAVQRAYNERQHGQAPEDDTK